MDMSDGRANSKGRLTRRREKGNRKMNKDHESSPAVSAAAAFFFDVRLVVALAGAFFLLVSTGALVLATRPDLVFFRTISFSVTAGAWE